MKILRTTYRGVVTFDVVLDGDPDQHTDALDEIEADVRELVEHAPAVMRVRKVHIEHQDGAWEDAED